MKRNYSGLHKCGHVANPSTFYIVILTLHEFHDCSIDMTVCFITGLFEELF